jgi:subtilisin family serine protease
MEKFLDDLLDALRKIIAWFRPPAGQTHRESDIVAPDLQLVPDTSWDGLHIDSNRIDLNLRLVVSLIEARDFEQLFRRTGIRVGADGVLVQPRLPLFLQLDSATLSRLMATPLEAHDFALRIPLAYLNELSVNPGLTWATALFEWDETPISPSTALGHASTLQGKLANVIRAKGVNRVSAPSPLQPCLEDSLFDIDLPADRTVKTRKLDGNGIIVGIIDDGCALAHRNFLVPGTTQSRIGYLWDQSRTPASGGAGWTAPLDAAGHQDFPGLELVHAAIDTAIGTFVKSNGLIGEDEVYDYLKYEIGLASHGTHVMDIAAGNGHSLMGTEGVACAADIIFVQLPTDLVDQGGPLLEDRILQGVAYIFARAGALGMARGLNKPVPAVVNISYGGYSGPHDGTSPLADGIDKLLAGKTDRAVVVSAGNGFEADCHARQVLQPGAAAQQLHWILSPEDPTANQLEIWYEANAELELSITPPRATAALKPPVGLGQSKIIKRPSDGKIVGWIHHVGTNGGSGPNVIRIHLNPTAGEEGSKLAASGAAPTQTQIPPSLAILTVPASSGTWRIDLQNVGKVPATFDAWIARDDLGRGSGRRQQQSRFDPDDADPCLTLADLATGKHAICVGAHNTATGEVSRYSASGPTRDQRSKPDVCAPAEEDAVGRGILCASSRSAQPSRMNGTSAAAPHVTGLVALLMQYNRDTNGHPLTADEICARIMDGATAGQLLDPPPLRSLLYNRHQEVDPHRPPGKKQRDHFDKVIGSGKINVPESAKLLP